MAIDGARYQLVQLTDNRTADNSPVVIKTESR